jgi:hypothetical protein
MIKQKNAKPKVKNKADPDTIYHDIIIAERHLFQDQNIIVTFSNKRRRKKKRLTMPERYKPKLEGDGDRHPLCLAMESYSEMLFEEEKKMKALLYEVSKTKIRSEEELGDWSYSEVDRAIKRRKIEVNQTILEQLIIQFLKKVLKKKKLKQKQQQKILNPKSLIPNTYNNTATI